MYEDMVFLLEDSEHEKSVHGDKNQASPEIQAFPF